MLTFKSSFCSPGTSLRAVARQPALAAAGAIVYGGSLAVLIAFWFTNAHDRLVGLVTSPVIPLATVGWAVVAVLLGRRRERARQQ